MTARKSVDSVKDETENTESEKSIENAKEDITETADGSEDAQSPVNTENAKNDPMKRMVKIKLFKDNEQYKDDFFVSLNGRTYQIQRGIEVEVPEAVAEIIKRSEESDMNTSVMICRAEAEYDNVK